MLHPRDAPSDNARVNTSIERTLAVLTGRSTRRTALILFVAVLAIYLTTASWGVRQSRDPIANALTSWRIVTAGTVTVDGYETPWLSLEEYGEGLFRWYVEHDGSAYTLYPPGTAIIGTPFYATGVLISSGLSTEFSPWPAAVAASVVAALTACLFFILLLRLVPSGTALSAALVFSFATPVWAVSADALWPHAPAQMWLLLAMLAMASSRYLSAGFLFGASIITRPLAVIGAIVTSVMEATQRRTIRPAMLTAMGTVAGAAALVVYNWVIFGRPSISGGYGSYPIDTLHELGVAGYFANLGGALISPSRGILVISPFIVLLLPGLGTAWKAAPGWVRSSAVGGLAYLLGLMAFSRYTGGAAYFGYRLPLQALTLMAPLLVLSWDTWVRPRIVARKAFAVLVLGALTFQAVAAVYPQLPII